MTRRVPFVADVYYGWVVVAYGTVPRWFPLRTTR